MTDVPARSVLAKMAVDPTAIGVGSQALEFISEDVKKRDTHLFSEGIRGTRSRRSHRVRKTQSVVSGSIVMEPTPTEFDWWIQRILGGTTAGGVTAVAETLPEFLVGVDRVTKVFTYSGVRVNRAVISGSEGQPIRLTVELEGETESVANAGTFPAVTYPTDNIFVFSDCTLTLLSVARKFRQFTLTIDNVVDSTRFNNSVSRTEISAMDRIVTLEVGVPYTSDNEGLYDAAIAGAAGVLAVSDGSTTYTFDFGNVKIPAESPGVSARQEEIELPLALNCYHDGTNAEIKCTKS